MPNESKALENKLDRDFLNYLILTKKLYDNVTSTDDRTLCEAWLTKLCGTCQTTVSEKRARNIYLSRLLLQMQEGKLRDVFLAAPQSSLESPYTVFGLPQDIEDIKGFQEMGFRLEDGGSGDFSEVGRDGRTYIATRKIQNGMMAYLAITITEGEPMWMPQEIRPARTQGVDDGVMRPTSPGRFVKRLAQFECVPLTKLRKSPEEREKVLEWMDKIIEDCNKWLRGQDPHNLDLETLFELLYQAYQEDPSKAELMKYPHEIRDILMRDIRERLTERRAEVSRRELILDQYEADEIVEELPFPEGQLDSVWYKCARKPMKDSVTTSMNRTYPPEVVDRFFELLIQERILIIERAEKDANKKISEIKSSNRDMLKKELIKLKKIKEKYSEYYNIYKEVEKFEEEYQNLKRQSGSVKADKSVRQQQTMKQKNELEKEIEEFQRRYDKERKNQGELVERLWQAKDCFGNTQCDIQAEDQKLKCEKEKLEVDMNKLKQVVYNQKKRYAELENQIKQKNMKKCIERK